MTRRDQASLEERVDQLVLDLNLMISTLREGIAAGGLTLPRQRWLARDLKAAPQIVCELRGAMEAYRAVATAPRPSAAVLPLDLDARPLHISDEDIR